MRRRPPIDTFWSGGRQIALVRGEGSFDRGGATRLGLADARDVLRRRFAETWSRARLVRALGDRAGRMEPAEALRRLEALLRAGTLEAWQLRSGLGEVVVAAFEELRSEPDERDREAIGTHWIRVVLVDMEDVPIAGRRYRIELPGGEVRYGRLDAEGAIDVARHTKGGVAKVVLLDLDRDAWMRATEREPVDGSEYEGPEAGESYERRISAGLDDCASSIAFRAGFFPATIWEHEENRALRDERPNPSALCAGDVVYVPPLRLKQIECAMDAEHRLKRRGVPDYLTVRLLDADGEPRAGLAYELHIEGEPPREGTIDGNGYLTEPISPIARRAELIVRDGKRIERRALRIGRLTPASGAIGVQSRLKNLGAYGGPLDGNLRTRASRRAIERFCRARDLPMDLSIDALLHEVAKAHERV